ncbi:adenylyl cyclase-associated protein 2 [Spea bombifrons]|uniref:adenylyl cyclase-associated protein 2 n=1 Tax=Spea bombifrons TaxID=233779 RepID=UPI00234B2C3F|nr:adenylyl cyclase-associated protein 2 [Spea bombifrons]XP_053322639.1 adenylyl cyclase-associated protein 2 [Spea bombifrons]
MADVQGLMDRLENAVLRLEAALSKSYPSTLTDSNIVNGINGDVAPFVEAFDALLKGPLEEYLKNSKVLGGDVETHASLVEKAFKAERAFLLYAAQHQKPPKAEETLILKPISERILEIQTFREKNRGSKMFNHLSAISESIPALGWIAMAPKPGPYVKEMADAATFYTNRVLKDYKTTDAHHVDWVKSYLTIWSELQAYIKEYHTTGISWGNTVLSTPPAVEGDPQVQNTSSGSCHPPPPPPPPPPCFPPMLDSQASKSKDDASQDRSALFAQLNQGEQITKGLKHVTDDEKTHKNPKLRGQGGQNRSPSKRHTPSPTSPKPLPHQTYCPLLELEGKKWRVEFQEGVNDLVISETELKQVAYIFKCKKTTLQIKGKINSIIIDNCTKLGLVFDDVVGIVEVINSKDVQIQVMGKVPTISINKTDGCHVYLSENSIDCEIVSAKSSEMNILVPQDGDYKEFPVPEQFKTSWDGSKLVTEPAEMMG